MTAAVLAVKQRFESRLVRPDAMWLGVAAMLLALVVAAEAAASWDGLVARLERWSLVRLGTTASLLAGLATAVGAVPVFFLARVREPLRAGMLAFGAGVMLAASFFSLLLPGFRAAVSAGAGASSAIAIVAAGAALGALFLYLSHEAIPHRPFAAGQARASAEKLKRIWLFVAAITLHNFPEGLAVGVGFGEGDLARGGALALGIGLQNVPEGLAVALALFAAGYGRARAWAAALASGLVEPVGGALGAGVVAVAQPLLPWALAFAAGAMLLVVGRDMIPESYGLGHRPRVTSALLAGFGVMMALDVALG